jgi:hypothetical protein
MNRAVHLALVLVLVMMSLVPLTASVAAQQSLPTEFLGTWEGRADTPNYFSRVTISLSGGQVGEIVGTIDYPAVESRTVACGGNVQLWSVSGSQVTLIEKLNYGTASCRYADGTITLTLQLDGSLAYTWSHPNNPAVLRGTLTRAAACRWTGTWWSSVYGYLRLAQSGASVSGDYDWDQGQIGGTVIGDTLSGTWNEAPSRQAPNDAGEFVFKMAADCQSFDGKWRYTFGDTWYFDWAAERVSN